MIWQFCTFGCLDLHQIQQAIKWCMGMIQILPYGSDWIISLPLLITYTFIPTLGGIQSRQESVLPGPGSVLQMWSIPVRGRGSDFQQYLSSQFPQECDHEDISWWGHYSLWGGKTLVVLQQCWIGFWKEFPCILTVFHHLVNCPTMSRVSQRKALWINKWLNCWFIHHISPQEAHLSSRFL